MIIRDAWNWLMGSGAGDYREGRDRVWRWRRNLRIKWSHFWLAYAATALYTFGHSATTYPIYEYHSYDEQQAGLPQVISNERTAMKSVPAGLLWPLYWTWEVMD